MAARSHGLDNLICVVDFNDQQADGPTTQALAQEAEAPKWQAFGWHAQEVDGNDLDALVAAFDAARNLSDPQPRVIICRTQMCKGVPFLEDREITHFVRVDPSEWERAIAILDNTMPA